MNISCFPSATTLLSLVPAPLFSRLQTYIYRSSYNKAIVNSDKCNTFSTRLVRFLRGVGTVSTLRDTCCERDSDGECWLRS